jgi:parallel beta-helix repeat protein
MLQEGSKDCVLSGCSARDNAGDGIRIDGTGKPGQLDPTRGYNNAVKDCTVLRSGQHGIHLSGATGQHISGNTVRDSSQRASGQYSHVMLDVAGAVPSTGNTITGNDLGMTPGVSRVPQYGICEVGGGDYNMAVANQLSGPAVGPMLRLRGAHSLGYAAHNGTAGEHPHTFAYAFDNPGFHGFTEWNFPPLLCGSSVQPPVTGIIYLLAMNIQNTGPLSAVHLFMSHAGYGLTAGQNLVGCYQVEAGQATLLASVDQTAAWSDARLNGHAVAAQLSTPLAVTAGAVILFGVLSNGTQPPAFSRAPGPTGLAANASLGNDRPYRVSICRGTELTSLPATIELAAGTTAADSLPFWIAAS